MSVINPILLFSLSTNNYCNFSLLRPLELKVHFLPPTTVIKETAAHAHKMFLILLRGSPDPSAWPYPLGIERPNQEPLLG